MNICVFCSANDLPQKYTDPAREFARFIAKHGHVLIYGGSDNGLMKIIASEVQDGGGKIVGISMEMLKDKARKNADEVVIAKDLGERKATMLERADVIVMLVGGIGTLDEVMGVLEMKKHKVHEKPIIILNTDNFYEGLKAQLQKMKDDGFLPCSLENLVYFADTPKEAIAYIDEHIANRSNS